MKQHLAILLLTLITAGAHAQDGLLGGLDSVPKKQYVTNAFKSSRVINGHSMEMIGAGVLDFRILHRFGQTDQGIYDIFGLDQASMRIGFDYGLANNLTIGFGRSTLRKELDGFVKFRVIQQSTGYHSFPVSVVLVAGTTVNTVKDADSIKQPFRGRVAYIYQAIVGRKISKRLTLQVTPTMIHRNIVQPGDDNEVYAVGLGGRFKLSKRIAFVCDYFMNLNGFPKDQFENPLSVGIDIETGGHVFQLHFSNSAGMNERAFLTETTGKWGKGEFRFGFNLSRVFTVKKKHNNKS